MRLLMRKTHDYPSSWIVLEMEESLALTLEDDYYPSYVGSCWTGHFDQDSSWDVLTTSEEEWL